MLVLTHQIQILKDCNNIEQPFFKISFKYAKFLNHNSFRKY